MNIASISLIFFLMISASADAIEEPQLRADQTFNSPDGRFTAHIDDSNNKVKIRNNHTGEIDNSMGYLPPIFSIKWTGDSNTIFTVEHVAGGSITSALHFSRGNWKRVTNIEPFNGDFCDVLKQITSDHGARLIYKSDADRKHFYTGAFDFNAENGKISNLVKHEIDVEIYRLLKYEK